VAAVSDWLARRSRRSRATKNEPIHLFHIGKTGGTALKQALLDYASPRFTVLLHGHGVTLADVPVGEKFMFVIRDPLSRFVSGFNGRLREDRPRYHYPWKEGERVAFGVFDTPDALGTALGSEDPELRGRAEQAMRDIGHVNTPYSFWLGDEAAFRARLPDLFFIAFQDRLADDFELLKRKLSLPEDARLPDDATVAHRTPESFSQELGDEARANLERWYAADLDFVRLCRELAPSVNGTAG
jgi:hypothetical protein